MRYFKHLLIMTIATLSMVGCKDDIDGIQLVDYKIQVVLEDDPRLANSKPEGLTVTVTNTNTGTKASYSTDKDGYITFTNLVGVYNIDVNGYVDSKYEDNGNLVGKSLRVGNAVKNEVFTLENKSKSLEAKIVIEGKGWVIKEMYTASTATLNGGNLRFDQFIEIYNNTDSVMYADGIAIGETRHQTTSGDNIYGTEIEKKTFLWTIYAIPGKTGDKKVAVQPGTGLVIAPQPIDHRENNSIDLRPPVSDYQWFDAYGSGEYSIDVPEVPNLERSYSSSLSVWVISVQMNRGFVILQLPEGMDMKTFVTENLDRRANNVGNTVISVSVPNEDILDAVDLGYKDQFYQKSLSSSLDMGRSYTLAAYNGKSIRRKIDEVKPDGRVVYQDTNNSTFDFWTSRTPSPKKYPTNDEVSHE